MLYQRRVMLCREMGSGGGIARPETEMMTGMDHLAGDAEKVAKIIVQDLTPNPPQPLFKGLCFSEPL